MRGNTGDMDSQPFYRFIQRTYGWHVVAQLAALYLLGGLPALVWGGALRAVWVYHITWFVNSASHVWGYQARRALTGLRSPSPQCPHHSETACRHCSRALLRHMQGVIER